MYVYITYIPSRSLLAVKNANKKDFGQISLSTKKGHNPGKNEFCESVLIHFSPKPPSLLADMFLVANC